MNKIEISTPDGQKLKCYFITKDQQFSSIQELIAYYTEYSLEESFPGLKTTLGIPYKDAITPTT